MTIEKPIPRKTALEWARSIAAMALSICLFGGIGYLIQLGL